MNLKKKLTSGIATALLGMALIGGGTFAYFNDTEASNNTFAAGTLDLSLNPSTVIDVENIKPGDWMNRSFELINDGTLDIAEVFLETDYSHIDFHNDNGAEDMAEHINVNFFWNEDKALLGPLSPDQVVYNTTLANLKGMTRDAVANAIFIPYLEERGGLEVGDRDTLYVQFEFLENGQDQNIFQGDSLKLDWTFTATQTAGESK